MPATSPLRLRHARSKYQTMELCLEDVSKRAQYRLEQLDCEGNTDAENVRVCLVAMRVLDCALPFGAYDQLAECNPGRVCRGERQPGACESHGAPLKLRASSRQPSAAVLRIALGVCPS